MSTEQQPWWREQPLGEQEIELLLALCDAHQTIAGRTAHPAVTAAATGSGLYVQAIAAALMTLGDKSGPLEEAHRFLNSRAIGTAKLDEFIAGGGRVPGWGNPQIKNRPDPAFEEVLELLDNHWPELHARLASVTQALHAAGKRLHPNAAAYSAAVATALGIPGHSIGYLWVLGRLGAWSATFNRSKL